MASVSDLTIKRQSGSDSYFASWTFGPKSEESADNTSKAIQVGDKVTVNSDAVWKNGAKPSSFVFSTTYYVRKLDGSYALLYSKPSGGNPTGWMDVKYLNGGTGSGSNTSTESVSEDQVENYEVEWYYDTGDGVWFSGSETTTEQKNATYNAPSNALKIRVKVKPVSKTYKKGDEDVTYWEGTWTSKDYTISEAQIPDAASTPSVVIDKFTLTATVNDITDSKTDKIQFEVYDGDDRIKVATVNVAACRAIYTCTITAGGKYRVRCRSVFTDGGTTVYGEWSNFSSESSTIPKAVSNPKAVADTSTSVKVTWSAVADATSYDVEYTINKAYFDSSSEVSSTTVESTTAYITGLEADEWFIRVRAKNDAGESSWSKIISVIIGTKPEPPTTWSLTTTVIVGEEAILYWVHNAEDGSKMSEAQIQLTIDGEVETVTVPGSTSDEEEENPIYSYVFNPKEYNEGAVILWKVRTKGIVSEYGDWSVQRTINLYAPPTIRFNLSTVDDILTTLPLTINATASPETQTPISYHVSIIANSSYETTDAIGNPIIVIAGTEIYSKIFDHSDWSFTTDIGPGDITLESGQNYAVKLTLAMDSGLTADNSLEFAVDWEDTVVYPMAGIAIDRDTLAAYISPFCITDTNDYAPDVTLSVYRREYNGTFTEIATNLINDKALTITDPHPALDYARYRIVARNVNTGAISYEDLPGHPVKEHAIIIQWDETWSDFNYMEGAAPDVTPYVGSMVKLPYNIDVSENYGNDVSLVEYIGRKHPVSYYGTQRGETATWNTDIDKSNKDLIYALRRLAAWNGDVYVREPSGIGYWAQITVSMSIKHLELVVPVSFTITRVEGSGI